MAGTEADPRKHKDDLIDQIGAPLYGETPAPPYLGVIEDMIFACFTFDPDRFRPFLPPELSLVPRSTAVIAVLHTRALGWGIRGADWIFPAALVQEMPAPDTAEACFIPEGLATGHVAGLIARHFHPCSPGHGRTEVGPEGIRCQAFAGDTPALRIKIRPDGPVNEDMSSLDRYFARSAAGELVHFVVSSQGPCQPAVLEELEFLPGAPAPWQAMAPVRLNWAMWIPQMLFNVSASEPFLTEDAAGLRASRAALLGILDRQGRACGILDGEGRILHANAALDRMAASHPALAGRRLHPGRGAATTRLRAAIAEAAGGAVTGPLLLPGPAAAALMLQIVPLDPVLAGPGTVLGLLDDLAQSRPPPQAGLLQLMGLTPAEARIAAAVGAGLPPREAALRLGLKESTVRSSLKVVFAKLGLTRQADLARLIARVGP